MLLLNHKTDTYFTDRWSVEGSVDLGTTVRVQPVPKAVHCSDFRENAETVSSAGSFDPGSSRAAVGRVDCLNTNNRFQLYSYCIYDFSPTLLFLKDNLNLTF